MEFNAAFYEGLLDSLHDGVYFVDLKRRITFWNRAAERISGYSKQEMLGQYCYDNILNHVDEKGHHLCLSGCPLQRTMEDSVVRETTVYLHHKQGHRVKINVHASPIRADGKVIGCCEVFTEVYEMKTEMGKGDMSHASIEALTMMALHDELTELPNRRYIDSFLESRFNEFVKLNLSFGVVFMDIDNFRDFNNRYGHEMGDRVLKTVANTLRNAVQKSDLIGRWGGEEFIAILTAVSETDLYLAAEKIRILVERSVIKTEVGNLNVTLSSGVTLIREEDSLSSLMSRVDELMYRSKRNGKNSVSLG